MSSPTAPELVKWYTRARRFPQLIGRTPDGAKIWGGPYTFTQAIGAGVIALIAVNTMGLWARYGFIGNTLLLVGVTYGGVLLLGRIPVGSRSPISFVTGSVHAALAPRTGRLRGRPVRPRRPHVVRHRVTVALDPPPPRQPARLRRPMALSAQPIPSTTKARTARHRVGKPRIAKPSTAKPDTAKPDISRPDTTRPDTTRPDISRPDTGKPDTTRPDTGKPDTQPRVTQPASAHPPVTPAAVKQPPVSQPPVTPPPVTQPPVPAPRPRDPVRSGGDDSQPPVAARRPNLTGVQTLLALGRTPPTERH